MVKKMGHPPSVDECFDLNELDRDDTDLDETGDLNDDKAEESKDEPVAAKLPAALGRLSISGPPPLLEGEVSEAYDELLARVSGNVKPVDVIEDIWTREVVDYIWENLRLRRVKTSLLAAAVAGALQEILASILDEEKDSKVITALVDEWTAGKPSARNHVSEYLEFGNLTFEDVLARAFKNEIDGIERIDRLITTTEGRRNAALREIDRHRATFARMLRKEIHGVEDSPNPKTIEH
jgi:hypothetical protein